MSALSSSASLFGQLGLRFDVPDCVHVRRNPDDSLIRRKHYERLRTKVVEIEDVHGIEDPQWEMKSLYGKK